MPEATRSILNHIPRLDGVLALLDGTRVRYELAGFETQIREGLRVGLGFTATVNIELRVARLTESVTVSGQSPVVDVATTKTSTNFDAQQLASLPNARDF